MMPKGAAARPLERDDIEIRSCDTGVEALAMAQMWQPDLIAFSSPLPDMGAEQFCHEVRRLGSLMDTRLLMITEQAGVVESELLHDKLDAHLISPLEPRQLVQTISGLLRFRLRDAPRVDVTLMAQLEGFGGIPEGGALLANIINLSELGGLVESPEYLEVGSSGRLSFYVPGSAERLLVEAIIRVQTDELMLHYGLEFLAVERFQRKLLRAFVISEQVAAETDDWEVAW